MQHLSYFQCRVTHPTADLGRKFLIFCNRKIQCCWGDVLGEDHFFISFPCFSLSIPCRLLSEAGCWARWRVRNRNVQ